MASTYRIYRIDNTPAGDGGKAGPDTLTYIGEATAASAAGAARAYFAGLVNGKGKTPDTPPRIAVIPARAVHELAPSIVTYARLRLS